MTKSDITFYIELHRKMWDWISKQTQFDIRGSADCEHAKSYFLHNTFDPDYFEYVNDCPACECAVELHGDIENFCQCCPIQWPFGTCIGSNGLFSRFCYEEDEEKQSKIAEQIRDLPINTAVVESCCR